MKGLLYGIFLQWKIDFRRKDILVIYYVMPLVFFLFMAGVFTTAMPDMKHTLAAAMVIFAICAGGFMGAPSSVVGFYGTDMKKAYQVGGIPYWTPLLNGFISAVIHLSIVSVIICILSPLLFGADSIKDYPAFIGSTLAFMLATIGIGMVLALFIKSQAKLSAIAIILFLPSIFLSGIMLPDDFLPDFLQTISKGVPASWAYDAMNGEAVLQNILMLLAVFVVAVIVMVIRLKLTEKE